MIVNGRKGKLTILLWDINCVDIIENNQNVFLNCQSHHPGLINQNSNFNSVQIVCLGSSRCVLESSSLVTL